MRAGSLASNYFVNKKEAARRLPLFSLANASGVDTTQLNSVSYAGNCEHVRGNPIVNAMRVREVDHIFKSFTQNELELLIHG
jgi:hypothetical protein